ncbi:MAG: TRAP transporter permease [Deinococcota bacterium]
MAAQDELQVTPQVSADTQATSAGGQSDSDQPASDQPASGQLSTKQRNLQGWQHWVIYGAGIAYVLFHIYILNIRAIDPLIFRSVHLSFGTAFGFALFKLWRSPQQGRYVSILDWVLIAASLACCGYFCYFFFSGRLPQLLFRIGVVPTPLDAIVAIVGVLLVLELTRRVVGWELPILALVFIGYGFVGPWLPGVLEHRGYDFDRLFSYIYSLNGIFGVTTAVSARYILIFIVFASFLEFSGVGEYFIRFSYSLTGGARGGPAKVAVVSSALMGMLNGTSAGNAVATGSFTIPLMRRVGYKPLFAAATEAVASTGGQILPPIMGAGAFIMAEIIGIPYGELILAAIIPALLYFAAVFFMVDLEAVKLKLLGLPRKELPDIKAVLRDAYLFIPVVLLIAVMLRGNSITRAGTLALLSSIVVSWFNKDTRMGLRRMADAMYAGVRAAVGLTAVCACAGIVVGIISLTGIGGRFSALLLATAQQNQVLALLFAMLICIILGMGMPTTAAYAVAASVVAPGLVRLGISPLVAHMFIFYYAVVSAITPPVALAAYSTAGIANTDPLKTALASFRLGLAAYLIPFMFFYNPALLLESSPLNIVGAVVIASVGVYLLASSLQAWLFGKLSLPWQLVTLAAAVLLILGSTVTNIVGIVLGAGVLTWQVYQKRQQMVQIPS